VAEYNEHLSHVDHCIDWLRVAAMCRGDVTVSVLQWDAPTKSKLESEYPVPHQCVDFGLIARWAEENAIDVSKKGVLERPA